MNEWEVFAKNLRTLREFHNVTVNTVASAIGVSQQAYSKWENPQIKVMPQADRIYEISKFFGVSPSELYYDNIQHRYYFILDYTEYYCSKIKLLEEIVREFPQDIVWQEILECAKYDLEKHEGKMLMVFPMTELEKVQYERERKYFNTDKMFSLRYAEKMWKGQVQMNLELSDAFILGKLEAMRKGVTGCSIIAIDEYDKQWRHHGGLVWLKGMDAVIQSISTF